MSEERPPDEVLGYVEGPGAFVPDFGSRWLDPASRERLLDLVRRVEKEPACWA